MATGTQRQGALLRLDRENEWVWQGEQRLQLTPKAFAVLRYLVDRPGRVVTKDELLREGWPDTVVSEWVLTTCIRQICRALRDERQTPRFIETVHRRGYRFIAAVQSPRSKVQSPQHPTPSPQAEAEAEACFLKAIEIARRQSAKSLELRAVMSLSRLWQQQGNKEEARHVLAEIYGWFTEEFDTADLQEARALLYELKSL